MKCFEIMRRYVTTKQMKQLDRIAIEKYGIPSLILMENAGRGIADVAEKMLGVTASRHFEDAEGRRSNLAGSGQAPQSQRLLRLRSGSPPRNDGRKNRILVVCGKGNNGGDGLAAARHLANRGYRVKVVLLARPNELKRDPRTNFEILQRMRIPIEIITSGRRSEVGPPRRERVGQPRSYKRINAWLTNSDLIIDAIFGVGLTRAVGGIYYKVISEINGSKKPVLAVDIPSGLDSDTGEELGVAIRARTTGTLGAPKRGLFFGKGPESSGKVTVLDISIPNTLTVSSFFDRSARS